MAPLKPSKQTQILLDSMAENTAQDNVHWEQLMENFDLLFSRVNDIGISQQSKAQIEFHANKVDKNYQEQQLLAQQVTATGKTVANLILSQQNADTRSVASLVQEEENPFHDQYKVGTSKSVPHRESKQPLSHVKHNSQHHSDSEQFPRHVLPKMQFLQFDGSHTKIWKDQCKDYFGIFNIPEKVWVTAAAMHFKDNAAKWLQAYKQTHKLQNLSTFCKDVELKFGADDYRNALSELLALEQTESVEAYTSAFQTLQYDICMHNSTYDDLFFTSKYISGLKDSIRGMVEAQVPSTVEQASRIAKIQQKILEKQKEKANKPAWTPKANNGVGRPEPKSAHLSTTFWRDRQFKGLQKSSWSMFHCGDKFELGHMETCVKKPRPQLNVLALNDLDKEIPEEVLNYLAVEEAIAEDFSNISLHALAGTETHGCFKLRAIVNKIVMLIPVDSGSSHSFISSFVTTAGLDPINTSIKQVKVVNGEILTSNKTIPALECWC
ncbi:hypothetical protein BS78_08G089100 [Paspalum vaginatum]|nr:hypothetical protein BS78_08G089100 [Paspalum vaginatum]